MYQSIAWYATLFFVFLIALAFSFVYGESKRLKDYAPIQVKGYKIRKFYFLGLVAILGLAAAISLSKLPYHDQSAKAATNDKIVNVTGKQFAWVLSDENFTVGDSVQFRVTSADVTHGFGLYDPNMKIIGQTQAMPGYTNIEYVTFKKPGTYKILCLEYCSTGHHLMMKDIVVKPKGGK
ncbi:cytochrome c oxidase subunit II [Neobacillus sp. PS3-40]|uniref:cytochrome c oxidase subunit II n=1 Tax=Neobacillus sp. PS3-40 TaxID=3070679 RepID=UPI0027E0AC69|nr:cytochrome c oxidase subunit II [Neobacillus sp. PS3-40]WML44891.1 cytochrome c oxidase subunit II [Neobacillus sp. PS3-40]